MNDVVPALLMLLARHRRREAELVALFDTASELAGQRDPDAVLKSIVHRARMLLGADLSYLSLNDPVVGDTYMRVTDGSISPLFQRVRLGMGEGLGGVVATGARHYATADYFADKRFNHTGPIDAAVRDEGLVAIVGVPLTLENRVIGVLYAADRAAREFTPDEVALLSSLADHAAIAIDTTNLLEETRRAHETIQAHNEAMQRAEDAHDRLTDLVLRGASVPEVASAVAEVLGGAVAVHDAEGVELTDTGIPARAVTASRAVLRDGIWVCAVLAGPELLGSIALSGRPSLDGADRRLFERASVVTALLLMLGRSVVEAENKVRGELITDLLAGRDGPGLVARGRRWGVDLTAPHTVLAIDGPAAAVTRVARARGGLAGVSGSYGVLVLPGDVDVAELAKTVGTAGAAGPVSGPAALTAAWDEAVRCLRALVALGRSGEGATMADLGFVGLLLGDRGDLDGYITATLGPVLEYDARRGTELVATLRAYFACGSNLTRTKDELHVHVNTVVQRLDRIATLLGEEWQSPARALEVQLALELHRVKG
ncbi:helix-turn-helix domain-containing protein [Amycolatopsis sp. cg5]|uniref:helix-turn-helix domain-containing protein n=1 Tax=Amycolatopsis sp. cg5 TaxID=3238802 RepID=UPI003523D66D